jgi:transposase
MATPPSHSQTVLPAENLVLDKIERPNNRFLLHAHVQQRVRCPTCDQVSRCRHSAYERRLQDLPWQGSAVELRLKVRRFRCRNPGCARKIFAEALPAVARPHGRRTTRVREIIRLIGYSAGGLAGSRILQRLAVPVSDDTVLRTVKCSDNAPANDAIRSLGVDDWAWRKGQSYGTIFVDLDRHRVVDLLPDRSTEGVKTWLERHPGIEIISRDRCGIYAEAAQQGAADALQVADRFHLIMNLSAAIERALEERTAELRLSSDVQQPDSVETPPQTECRPTAAERQTQQRRNRRHADSQRAARFGLQRSDFDLGLFSLFEYPLAAIEINLALFRESNTARSSLDQAHS